MPMQDFQRLADAIQARTTALGWSQQDLVSHSRLSRTTIQKLWGGDTTYAPSRATRAAVERALGWSPGSVTAVLAGGDPTIAEVVEEGGREASGPKAVPPMPLKVQLTLEDGRTLDYDVVTIDVDGEPLSVIALAQTSVYDGDDKKGVLRKQLDVFARIVDLIRAEATPVADGESEHDDIR